MRGCSIAVAAMLAGCSKSAPPAPNNELERFERDLPDHKPFHGVYVAPSGIYVDRVLLSSVAELPAKLGAVRSQLAAAADPADATPVAPVVLDLDAATLPVALALLQALTGVQFDLSVRLHPTEDNPDPYEPVCRVELDDKPRPADNEVRLSVLLTPSEIWLGLSRVNEFQRIPRVGNDLDWVKLEDTLKAHRASAFFADRDDLELAAEPGVTPAQLVTAIEIACGPRIYFGTISIVAPEQLSARPAL